MAGKVENKKLEEYENENYYLLRWSDKQYFPYNWLGLSDEDNSAHSTDRQLCECECFQQCYISVYSLTIAFCTIS